MHQIDMVPKKSRWMVARVTKFSAFIPMKGALLTAAACCIAPNATAAELELPHYRVELVVAKGLSACDRRDDFDAVLDFALGQPLVAPPFSRVLTVRVERTPSRAYSVDLDFADLEGHVLETIHREFPASMCCYEVLFKSALAAAYQMENPKGLQDAEPSPPPPPPPLKAIETCPEPRRPTDTPPATSRLPLKPQRRWFFGAGGFFVYGIAPEIVAGGQLSAGVQLDSRWSIEVDGSSTFPLKTRPAGPTLIEVATSTSGTLAACYRLNASFGFCGLAEGGRTWARTLNLVYPKADSTAFFGVGPRVFLEHPIGERLAIRVDIDVVKTVVVSDFKESIPYVWNKAQVTASLGASLFVAF